MNDKICFGFKFNYYRVLLLSKFRKTEKNTLKRYNLQLDSLEYLSEYLDDPEKSEIYYWLLNNNIRPFPYDFIERYNANDMEVSYDKDKGMYFTNYKGKKMYLKKGMNKKKAKEYLKEIYSEQDNESPHKYQYSREEVENKVVADIGAAEGFFSLDIIDYAKRVIIFECDDLWYEALKATFEPYGDKVTIVKKYVSNNDGNENITLDTYFKDSEIDFLKADIEGFEKNMIEGGRNVFKHKLSGFLLCSYHKQDDEKYFNDNLKNEFNLYPNKRYMFLPGDPEQKAPYIRRGVIHGVRS